MLASQSMAVCLIALLAVQGAWATTYYVDSTNGAEGASGTEAEPLASIAAALAKEDVTEVVLAKGHYAPRETITLDKAVVVRGADGAKKEDVRISGSNARKVFRLNHVGAVLRGVTVEDGYQNQGQGAGVDVTAGTIIDCIVRNCKGVFGSRGMVYLGGDSAFCFNCVITNYQGSAFGGGQRPGGCLCVTKGKAANCFMSGGHADTGVDFWGPGLRIDGGMVANCTIVGNQSSHDGAVYAAGGKVYNCLIWNNTSDGGTATGYDVVFPGDAAGNYSAKNLSVLDTCVARYAPNDTCIAANDVTATGDFWTPLPGSPVIDVGKSDLDWLPETDLNGNPRKVGEKVDVGCCEYQDAVAALAFVSSTHQGACPLAVTFVATLAKATASSYEWNFGDGTETVTTTEPFAEHTYQKVGSFYPSVSAGGLSWTATSPIECFSAEISVTTAAELDAALAVVRDGQTIVLAKGDYPSTAQRLMTSKVTLRGATGKPEDVVLKTTKAGYRHLFVNNPVARLESLTVDGGNFSSGVNGFVCLGENGGTATNCIFRNGRKNGNGHGSVGLLGAKSMMTHCIVTNNTSESDGQGAYNSSGVDVRAGKVSNCLIANNTMTGSHEPDHKYSAAGALLYGGTIENCTIVDNNGDKCGGVRAESSGSVRNCIICNNTATIRGAGYHNIWPGSDSKFTNCMFDKEKVSGTGCGFVESFTSLFAGYSVGNLTPASTNLIDKGAEQTIAVSVDLAGKERVMGAAIDIGAYEFDPNVFAVTLKTSLTEGFEPLSVVLTAEVSGTNGVDDMIFTWRIVGENEQVKTNVNTLVLGNLTAGALNVEVSVENGTTHETKSDLKTGLVNVVPKVMKVIEGNPGAAFPFDTEANAAASVKVALDRTIDKGVIELVPGVAHRLCGTMTIDKSVTIRGAGSTPDETLLEAVQPSVSGIGFSDAEIVLKNPGARLENMTIKTVAVSNVKGISIGADGGTISNCVLTGSANEAFIRNQSDFGVVTHCVITNVFVTTLSGGGIRPKGFICDSSGKSRYSNLLIVDNSFQPGEAFPFFFIRGVMENCTIVRNNFKLGAITDWDTVYNPNVDGNGKGGTIRHVYLFGASAKAENCVFACNMTNRVSALLLNMSSDAGGYGGSVGDCQVFNGTKPAPELAAIASAEAIFRRPARGDWRLKGDSPARDIVPKAELPADLPATDLGGNPRVYSVGLDAGCYECMSGGTMLIVR